MDKIYSRQNQPEQWLILPLSLLQTGFACPARQQKTNKKNLPLGRFFLLAPAA